MPGKTHETVTVSINQGKLKCDPDFVHLYWNAGPADIRWVFKDMPTAAKSAVVEFLETKPAKYPVDPGTPGGFRPRGVHRGAGHAPAGAGSHLSDLVTWGNTREQGYFYYEIRVLDDKGRVIAQADPGGTNNGDPGPGN